MRRLEIRPQEFAAAADAPVLAGQIVELAKICGRKNIAAGATESELSGMRVQLATTYVAQCLKPDCL